MQTTTLKRLAILASLFVAGTAEAALCSRVKTFVDGAVLAASELNTEYNTVFDCVNSISDSNITASAAIDPKKLGASIAGDGISRNGSTGVLAVSVDDTSVEISGDTVRLKANGTSNAKIRQSAGVSVIGRSANSTGDVADITAGSNGQVLKRTADALSFAQVATADIADAAVTHAKLAARATGTSVAAGGIATSASSGTQDITSTSFTDVTNQSVTIVTTGRPVMLTLIDGDPATSGGSYYGTSATSTTAAEAFYRFDRSGTPVTTDGVRVSTIGVSGTLALRLPPSTLSMIDHPSAGTYTYKLQAKGSGGTTSAAIRSVKLVAYEL